jgi:hypothetical protein
MRFQAPPPRRPRIPAMAVITPASTRLASPIALGRLGGGAWNLINRADKKRERREVAVEELLKLQIAGLEADRLQERQDAELRERRMKRYNSRIKSAAGKWREQLIANKIDPEPADWPEDEDD